LTSGVRIVTVWAERSSGCLTNQHIVDRRVAMKYRLNARNAAIASLIVLGSCLLWSTWPSLASMADRWSRDPRYAHGYFVPMFAVALLWMQRGRLEGVKRSPSTWGLALLSLGAAVQLVGGYYRIDSLEGLALLPDLGGICLLLGGWRVLGWAWPSIAFLAFMVPLPWRLETALGGPLQFLATTASTYLLQTLGFMAFAEGNVIQLNEARIGVVDACSGLSMLITFIALSTAAALVVKRPLLDRAVLVASSVPVALVANIARIVLTGVLHETIGGHAPSTFYHDLAGWVMMPLALVLYWVEIKILSRLLAEDRHEATPVLDLLGSRRPASPTTRYKPSAL
jgi:exosortase